MSCKDIADLWLASTDRAAFVAAMEHAMDSATDPNAEQTMDDMPAPTLSDSGMGTDLDASVRLVERQHRNIKYCPGIGYLLWDGRRYAPDCTGGVMELAKQSARENSRAAMEIAGSEERKTAVSRAMALESGNHLKAAVDLAKSDARIVVRVDDLDADPWLLNVMNGTLDLRTGTLRPHERGDLMTKLAPVEHDADAVHPALAKYLMMLDRQMPGMSEFLARYLGITLTGDASVESMGLIQGDAASGKTTLAEAMGAMLGDYAVKLPFDSFCLGRHGRSPGAATPDLVRLRGARFAFASEGDSSARLDAGTVKLITGNESVTARSLFSNPITFRQTWKLFLVSNYDPKCDADDTGLWRRLVKIRFNAIPEANRDPGIKAALVSDPKARSALLAWAARGCRDWLQRGGGRLGLAIPGEVATWTESYRQAMDPLGQWWADAMGDYHLRPSGSVPIAELRDNYETWCNDAGFTPVLGKRFNQYLEGKGLKRTSARFDGQKTKVWQGLAAGGGTTGTGFPKVPTHPAYIETFGKPVPPVPAPEGHQTELVSR